MSSAPPLSVAMSVYNAQRYLAEAVDSVLAQTFGDFEFLIVDDGSTDASPRLLEQYARRDPRIRLIRHENRGITRSRNEALAAARGEFLALMDSDDISLPMRFAMQIEYLRVHPQCLAVGCRTLMIDPDGLPIRMWDFFETHEEIDLAHMERRGPGIVNPSVMMRRQAAIDVGGYREQFQVCEDQDLFMRLAERGRLANLPEMLFKYRQHPGSACHSRRQRIQQDRDAVIADACARRGLPPRPPDDGVGNSMTHTDYHRIWGWWALQAGYLKTARKHALATLTRAPLSRESWRLAYCTLRGG